MFNTKKIPIQNTGLLNKLILDFITHPNKLQDFYSNYFNISGIEKQINETVFNVNRNELSQELFNQSQLVSNTHNVSLTNIELLKNKNTFSITTGHQLCINTGPLYFIYKIISVINCCKILNTKFPNYNFAPVYWMASEDHDFEEINHFNLFSKKLIWNSNQAGAVGNFETNGLEEILNEYSLILGENTNAEYLKELFKNSYLNHSNLSNATRYLVNELFGKHGLITIDGDNITLKQNFKSIFNNDIVENKPFYSVSSTIKKLELLGYSAQVNPRQINCFYKTNNLRARIEKTEKGYSVVGTDLIFSESEIKNIIENKPECLSPNVVLRPVYQQTILPNLIYIGGPGEIAYWLQYKQMFLDLKVNFPVLMLRNFVTIIDSATKSKLTKLEIEAEEIFKTENELIQNLQEKKSQLFSLKNEKELIEKNYTIIFDKINTIDKTLLNNAQAELQKAINGLNVIESKANKAIKQKFETEINQIKNIKNKLFPNQSPQERYENFSSFYLNYGEDFFKNLFEKLDPFYNEMLIIEENENK